VKSTEHKDLTIRPSLLRGWLRIPIAQILVLALFISLLPAPAHAAWQNLSGDLPNGMTGTTKALLGVSGALIATTLILLIVKKHHQTALKLDAPPVKIDDAAPGQAAKQSVPVTNLMNGPVTVKAVTVDDKSGALTIGDVRQTPFTLAPGEKFEIPVTLAVSHSGGKARIRIVATAERLKKEGVKFVEVSFGHHKSKLAKLIP
jgi:hypothetical protein